MSEYYRRKSALIGSGDDTYQRMQKLGEGTYGVVYKGLHISSQHTVALKKVRLLHRDEGISATTIRELSLLRDLSAHPNIVSLRSTVVTEHHLYAVFEFCDCDLKRYLNKHKGNGGLQFGEMQDVMHQMLQGLAFCHARRALHRDLKPQNILIQKVRGRVVVKLCDFGLSRTISLREQEWTHEVVTLWYRPPEILMGDDRYSAAIDIWSAGCIIGEMALNSKPLFRGDSEITQLMEIFKVCGTPDVRGTKMDAHKMKFYSKQYPKWKRRSMCEVVPSMSVLGQDLIGRMLTLNPRKRVSARQALRHPFFQEQQY